ncbi:hypothetical protein CCR85_01145 [Rhodothalassium salexigens]|uniref:hypothetical protein n=1 Tax=Rhodothalassium salexigens TaxID=1086 RepID=UPI001913AD7B|nr:hypothetical protein [Rhodothalassium salexigens]MBK5910099.1 hypothetical protein [Rhodothalassium salexigens]MBK5920712.1 hypothetical protein [Rhodothalassium salexigens]
MPTPIDHQRAEPIYAYLCERARAGGRTPTEREIGAAIGMCGEAVRRAMPVLVEQGRVCRPHRDGWRPGGMVLPELGLTMAPPPAPQRDCDWPTKREREAEARRVHAILSRRGYGEDDLSIAPQSVPGPSINWRDHRSGPPAASSAADLEVGA